MRQWLMAAFLAIAAGSSSLPAAQTAATPRGQAPQSPPFKALASNRLLGDAVHEPAAVLIWNAVGSTVTAAGVQDVAPKTDQEWLRLRDAGVILSEGANLLMLPPRAMNNDEWMKMSVALVDAGELARKAAEAKDPDKLLEAGAEVFTACENCHQKYTGAAIQTNPRTNR